MTSNTVVDAITRAAHEQGVPLALAMAIAHQESGLNPAAVGDNGHSVGLFQLNDQGEGAGMSVAARQDPYTNASIALRQVGQVLRANPNMDWGTVAARAQRPADQAGYATSINRNLGSTATTSGGTAGSGTPVGIPNALPQYDPDTKVSINSYGYIAALAKDVPDIAKLMKKYAGRDLSNGAVVARLEAEIKNTRWYQTHDAGHRTMQILKSTDPTEYNRQLGEMSKQVQLEASKQGTQLDPATSIAFAKNALAEGWTTPQIDKYLAGQYQMQQQAAAPNPAGQAPAVGAPTTAPQGTGDIGGLQRQFTQQAADYLVPVSDQAVLGWAQRTVAGQTTADDYTNYLKEQAKSLFPGMGTAIDAGVTPGQYTDPYKQLASQVLQLPADQVNFNDPKWGRALFQVDAKTGARTSMSLADWAHTLRSDPTYGYAKTPGAKQQASDMTQQILDEFGAVGNYGGNG